MKVTDGKGGIASAAVVVDIAPSVNTDPTATHAVGKPNSATGAVTVTVKATDKDKDTLTYSVGTAPANGGVTVDAKGKFTYTPPTPPRRRWLPVRQPRTPSRSQCPMATADRSPTR